MAKQLQRGALRARRRSLYISIPDHYQGEFEFRGVLRLLHPSDSAPQGPPGSGESVAPESNGIHPQVAVASDWLTVKECALLLMEDLPMLDLAKAKARVSKAASSGRIRTNGMTGSDRRIDRDNFSTWRITQRNRDLDAAEKIA